MRSMAILRLSEEAGGACRAGRAQGRANRAPAHLRSETASRRQPPSLFLAVHTKLKPPFLGYRFKVSVFDVVQ